MLGIIRSYSIVWWSRSFMIHSMYDSMFCGVSICQSKLGREEGEGGKMSTGMRLSDRHERCCNLDNVRYVTI